MKKILVLILALAMTCGMLVSCENAQSLLEKADAALENTPYTLTMTMNFECDDEELNEIFSVMNMEIPVTIDGNNLAMDMSMDMAGYAVDMKVTVADMVMYYDMSMIGQSIKMKAEMNEEQYKEFLADSNTEMAVNPEDFSELTVESKDGKKYIACAKISEEGLKELNDIMKDTIDAIGGEASVSDISYGVTLNDGKYESMDMTCVYSVTVLGETYNVTFKLGAEFSYDNVAEITAPADADTYQDMSFDDIMG